MSLKGPPVKNNRRSPLRMADGGIVPGQPPVSPFSLLGMARGAASGYNTMRNGLSDAMSATAARFQPPPGYIPAAAPQPQMAPAPTAIAQPVIPAAVAGGGIGNISGYAAGAQNVMQRREAAAGLRDGTPYLRGPGGPTDDMIDAKLSHGEAVLPADTVQHLGPENIEALIDATHKPVKSKGLRHYANGTSLVARPNFIFGDNGPAPSQPGSAVATRPYEPNFTVGGGGADPTAARQPFDVEGTARAVSDGVTDVAPKSSYGAMARGVLGKAGALSAVGMGTYDAANGLREGDYGRAALGAADAAAGASLVTPAAPVGAAWLGGRALSGAGQMAVDHMGTDTVDAIGGVINHGLRSIGMGTDDEAYQTDKAAVRMGMVSPISGARGPGATTASTQQPTGTSGEMTVDDGGKDVAGAPGVRRYGNEYTNNGTGAGPQISPNPNEGLERQARANAIYRSIGEEGMRGGPQMSVVPDSQGAERDARNAGVKSILGGHGRLQSREAELAESTREHDLQHSLGLRGQDVQAETARAQTAATMRGQDLTYGATTRGQDMSSATARLQGQMQKMQQDRAYNLDVQKFGHEQARDNFTQREAADKNLQSNLESRFRTTGADGKDAPDTAAIASYRGAVDKTIPALVQALQQKGTPEALAKANDLAQRGAAALDPSDHDRMVDLFQRRERMAGARGLGPNAGTYQHSDNLLDYQQTGVDPRTFGGNRIVTKAGSVSVNDLRYKDGPANSFFPDFNKVENRNNTRGLRVE